MIYTEQPITEDIVISSLSIASWQTVRLTGTRRNVTISHLSIEEGGKLIIGEHLIYLPNSDVAAALALRKSGRVVKASADLLRHVWISRLAASPQPRLPEGDGVPGVVLQETLFGDCNGDGVIDSNDFVVSDIGGGAGLHNEADALGDFDGDGRTGEADIALMNLAYEKANPVYPPA